MASIESLKESHFFMSSKYCFSMTIGGSADLSCYLSAARLCHNVAQETDKSVWTGLDWHQALKMKTGRSAKECIFVYSDLSILCWM